MQKALVTGGSGFFGISLVKGLLDKKYQVKVIDLEDLNAPEVKGSVEFIKGDIRDRELLATVSKNMDYVFHNAAILPVSRSKKKLFWDVNVYGTKNVLEASLSNSVKRVVFISSSSPYGIHKDVPITENTEFKPVCNYGRSKIEAENICNEYRKKGLDVVILRPRTIVGEGRLGLFQILYSWIADNKNIYLIGKGNNLFQFLSDKDLAEACILSIERDCRNEDFNLGAQEFRTVREDLKRLIDYAGSSSKIISLPLGFAKGILALLNTLNLAPFTPWHYKTSDKPFYFDISKAKDKLGWQPKMSNFQMFKASYDWYMSHRKEVDSSFGTTHRKSVRQKILKILKNFS